MPLTVVADASLIFRFLVPNPSQAQIRAQVASWIGTDVRLVAPALWTYGLRIAALRMRCDNPGSTMSVRPKPPRRRLRRPYCFFHSITEPVVESRMTFLPSTNSSN